MADSLPFRTKLFALFEGFTNKPISEVPPEEIPARRRARARLLSSPVGRFVAGRPHPETRIEDRWVELDPVEVDGLEPESAPVTLRLRIYRPGGARGGPLPLVVLFHGGGWVLGDPEQDEWWASHMAVRTPCVVVSVDYRLAPEHPYPAAVLDCWSSLRWIVGHAAGLGGDPSRVVVAGDSAGGNLAAVTAELAVRSGGPGLAGQVLIYPAVEMVEEFPSEREFAEAPVLTSRGMRAFVRLYMGDADPYAPTAAPLRGSLAGAVVPALVQTAGHDPLRDNGIRYIEALRSKGGDVTATDYPDAVHGYLSLPGISPSAPRALDEVITFVRRVTAGDPASPHRDEPDPVAGS
ncbi:alpha/beta hydrolase [Rhodococcus sp. Z13]|uniref:Alpha/beta hydrolase n=1 Tax=Rhodococcus sacchari TaxID=2962047 RepID=A0ACD4DHC7_9NOCA|nr:alpha/beta hydrolase [Rhodococcus sp. Z13]UYP19399.1 alpha/beta hydrolase [Rhodococcus sp. Z13]